MTYYINLSVSLYRAENADTWRIRFHGLGEMWLSAYEARRLRDWLNKEYPEADLAGEATTRDTSVVYNLSAQALDVAYDAGFGAKRKVSVVPRHVWFGTNAEHPDKQWFIRGRNTKTNATVDLPLFGMTATAPTPKPVTKYVVEGTGEDGTDNFSPAGNKPPFRIFCHATQTYVPGDFASHLEAARVCGQLNTHAK